MSVRRAGEHVFIHARNELVRRAGKIPCDLLFNRASFLFPLLLGIVHVLHASRVDAQCDFEIVGRHRGVILRDVLLSLGIIVPAELRVKRRDLVAGQPRAAAESHVFLRMRHPRKSVGAFIRSCKIILLDGHNRRERIAHHDHAQAVSQSHPANVRGRPVQEMAESDHHRYEAHHESRPHECLQPF